MGGAQSSEYDGSTNISPAERVSQHNVAQGWVSDRSGEWAASAVTALGSRNVLIQQHAIDALLRDASSQNLRPQWLAEWAAAGAIPALVVGAAGMEDSLAASIQGRRLREAVLKLLLVAPLGAVREFLAAVVVQMELACPCSVPLCQLLLAALTLPTVCKAAVEFNLSDVLLDQYDSIQMDRMRGSQAVGTVLDPSAGAGSSWLRIMATRSAQGTGIQDAAGASRLSLGSDSQQLDFPGPNRRASTGSFTRTARRAASIEWLSAHVEEADIGGSTHLLPVVPLTLPAAPANSIYTPSAAAELAALGGAVGESLVAADLAALVSHKRTARMRSVASFASIAALTSPMGAPAPGRDPSSHPLAGPPRMRPLPTLTPLQLPASREGSESGRSGPRSSPGTDAASVPTSWTNSLTSAPSSPTGGAAHGSFPPLSGDASAGSGCLDSPVGVAAELQVQCAVLQALLLMMPLTSDAGTAGDSRDPTSALIRTLYPVVRQNGDVEECQGQLRQLCIDVLHANAGLRLRSVQLLLSSQPDSGAVAPPIPGEHILLDHACASLSAATAGGHVLPQRYRELAALLRLLVDYTTAGADPSVAASIVEAAGPSLVSIQAALIEDGGTALPAEDALTAALLQLYTVLCCAAEGDAASGQLLIQHMLTGPTAISPLAERYALRMFAIERAQAVLRSGVGARNMRKEGGQRRFNDEKITVLQFYIALAKLVGRQPSASRVDAARLSQGAQTQQPAWARSGQDDLTGSTTTPSGSNNSASGGSGDGTGMKSPTRGGMGLTRRRAASVFAFLVAPPDGLALAILQSEDSRDTHLRQGALPEMHALVLQFLAAAFEVPGNPFLDQQRIGDFFIHMHFMHFAKLYNSKGGTTSEGLTTCRLHLQVLESLARWPGEAVRRRFFQLRVMDYLVRELSTEMDMAQGTPLQGGLPTGRSGCSSGPPTSATLQDRNAAASLARSVAGRSKHRGSSEGRQSARASSDRRSRSSRSNDSGSHVPVPMLSLRSDRSGEDKGGQERMRSVRNSIQSNRSITWADEEDNATVSSVQAICHASPALTSDSGSDSGDSDREQDSGEPHSSQRSHPSAARPMGVPSLNFASGDVPQRRKSDSRSSYTLDSDQGSGQGTSRSRRASGAISATSFSQPSLSDVRPRSAPLTASESSTVPHLQLQAEGVAQSADADSSLRLYGKSSDGISGSSTPNPSGSGPVSVSPKRHSGYLGGSFLPKPLDGVSGGGTLSGSGRRRSLDSRIPLAPHLQSPAAAVAAVAVQGFGVKESEVQRRVPAQLRHGGIPPSPRGLSLHLPRSTPRGPNSARLSTGLAIGGLPRSGGASFPVSGASTSSPSTLPSSERIQDAFLSPLTGGSPTLSDSAVLGTSPAGASPDSRVAPSGKAKSLAPLVEQKSLETAGLKIGTGPSFDRLSDSQLQAGRGIRGTALVSASSGGLSTGPSACESSNPSSSASEGSSSRESDGSSDGDSDAGLQQSARSQRSSQCDSQRSDQRRRRSRVVRNSRAVEQSSSPPALPTGFKFSGDADEDAAMLEALEECGSSVSGSESPSPSSQQGQDSDARNGSDASTISNDGGRVRSLSRGGAGRLKGLGQSQGIGQGAAPVPRLGIGGFGDRPLHSTQQQVQDDLKAFGIRTPDVPSDGGADASVFERRGGGVDGFGWREGTTVRRPLQLLRTLSGMEDAGIARGKLQTGNTLPSQPEHQRLCTEEDEAAAAQLSYSAVRRSRGLYRDEGLHSSLLRLVLSLLLTPDGRLEHTYTDKLPLLRRMQNVPHVLYHHLSHRENGRLIGELLEAAEGLRPGAPRLLHLLCRPLFHGAMYTQRTRIARGAYAEVFQARLPYIGHCPGEVALKVLDVPDSVYNDCTLVEVFSEVALLERLAGRPSICNLYDYGLDGEHFYMVMRRYGCSLRDWRLALPTEAAPQLRLYLAIFADVLRAVQALHAANVVHFDLKCDNIQLEPLSGASTADVAAPPSEQPPFRVVLIDFGESCDFGDELGGFTMRNRGTDCVKSPEMLLVSNAQKKARNTYDRRHEMGAGAPSDVWSLGCLLYELVTGSYLFADDDWIKMFVRITKSDEAVLAPAVVSSLAALPGLPDLLCFMLVRDAQRRPTIADVLQRLETLTSTSKVSSKGWLPYQRPPLPKNTSAQPTTPTATAAAVASPFSVQASIQQPDRALLRRRSSATKPYWSPARQSPGYRAPQEASLACEADLSYRICEYYLSIISLVVPESVYLGSVESLGSPAGLKLHRIDHVLLLCGLPGGVSSSSRETPISRSGSSNSLPDAGHLTPSAAAGPLSNRGGTNVTGIQRSQGAADVERLLRDRATAAAVVACSAARAVCRLVTLPPLHHQQGAAGSSTPCLQQQLPAILQHVAAATATTTPSGRRGRILVAAAAGYDGDAAVVVIAHLMSSQGLSCHEAVLETSRRRAALQLKDRHTEVLAAWAAQNKASVYRSSAD